MCLKITPGKNIILKIAPHGGAGGGVNYIRWGKMSCRRGAKVVYRGFVGGSHYSHKGAGANYLCLPRNPDYMSLQNPSSPSYLYGSEYESYNKVFGKTTHDYNVPCVSCHVAHQSSKIMIPAKTTCPRGWTKEYKGYLMTEHYNHPRNAVYECVDHNPDIISGTKANSNGALFYFVASSCSGVPCKPYIASKAITCVVCTK